MDPHPDNAERRELVIVLYQQGKSYKDIEAATGYTTRGLTKILEKARKAGDPRAKVRGATQELRTEMRHKTLRWAQDSGHLPGRLLLDLGADVGTGGVACDFDEGRW